MRAFLVDAIGAGSDIVEARDAAGVLELLDRPGARFDIVVGDGARSPQPPFGFSCVPLVHTIFRRWPWIPVVIVTAEPDTRRLLADVLLTGVRRVFKTPFATGDMTELISRVRPGSGTRGPDRSRTVVKIKRILAFLGEEVGEIPNLGALAAMSAMSPSHFSHVFHAVAGRSLRDYLRDLRLKRAHELLTTSKLSLTVVAIDSGFYDLPHLDKVFRRRFGMSPQEFRMRHLKDGTR